MDEFKAEHLLVTGGAGFIGSMYVRQSLAAYPTRRITILDKLTYAGNLANLAGIVDEPRLTFVQGDIADPPTVRACLEGVDTVVNFAAETHVDRSIQDAGSFVLTDVYGLQVLLNAALTAGIRRFVQVSTDEVYGDIESGASRESDPLLPRSPYAASKAGGELLARSYAITHGLNVVITRGSNTFGPRQHPEKLVPLFITNALDGKPLPVYGDGLQVRDWIAVEDHCAGIEVVLRRGAAGEAYNIGGGHPLTNLRITEQILALCGRGPELIRHVRDRKAHDRRYALDCEKARTLGWAPTRPFAEALAQTVAWYRDNEDWWRPTLESSAFVEHVRQTYEGAVIG
ncbi:MAG TPA: dTDP-glucose 4,6-dehydratase [Chloroflexota bacterium]|nr:dTDP-glucose 4,6-dehydratase [Chloroflexota bacterium]